MLIVHEVSVHLSVDLQSPESKYCICSIGEETRLRQAERVEWTSRLDQQDLNPGLLTLSLVSALLPLTSPTCTSFSPSAVLSEDAASPYSLLAPSCTTLDLLASSFLIWNHMDLIDQEATQPEKCVFCFSWQRKTFKEMSSNPCFLRIHVCVACVLTLWLVRSVRLSHEMHCFNKHSATKTSKC